MATRMHDSIEAASLGRRFCLVADPTEIPHRHFVDLDLTPCAEGAWLVCLAEGGGVNSFTGRETNGSKRQEGGEAK